MTTMAPLVWISVLLMSISQTAYGLLCFNCTNQLIPRLCEKLESCNSDEVCYIRSEDINSETLFSSGCKRTAECGNIASIVGKRAPFPTYECCGQDFCNNEGFGYVDLPLTLRGPDCFYCNRLETAAKCMHIQACAMDEACNVTANTIPCNDDKGTCCDQDYCNDDCVHTTTTTTTIRTTQTTQTLPTTLRIQTSPSTTMTTSDTQSTAPSTTMTTQSLNTTDITSTTPALNTTDTTSTTSSPTTTTTEDFTTSQVITTSMELTTTSAIVTAQTAIVCRIHSPPSNGQVTVSTTINSQTATYTCNAGYDLTGSPTRTCRPDGTWSGVAPICILKGTTVCDKDAGFVNIGYSANPFCVKVYTEAHPFPEAVLYCDFESAKLISPNSADKMNDIRRYMHANYPSVNLFYIGVLDSSNDQTNYQYSNGQPATYLSFMPGEPSIHTLCTGSNGTQGYDWQSTPCSSLLPFMCEAAPQMP